MGSLIVASGGARIAVRTWGEQGRPLVGLHPGVGDSRIWRWSAPAWAEAGYRVVAPDRRGFGATQCRPEPHDDLDDLLAVTEATNARPAVVVGNSMGGGLALDLALSHPDHVDALVLIAPSPSGYDDRDWPTTSAEAELDRSIEAAEAAGLVDEVNRLEVHYWLDGVDQPEGRVSGEPRALMTEMNSAALRAAPVGEPATRPPAWPRLSTIRCPVLVVVGELDLPGVVRQSREVADRVADGRVVTIPDSAHCPQLDRPDALDRVVLSFLATIGP